MVRGQSRGRGRGRGTGSGTSREVTTTASQSATDSQGSSGSKGMNDTAHGTDGRGAMAGQATMSNHSHSHNIRGHPRIHDGGHERAVAQPKGASGPPPTAAAPSVLVVRLPPRRMVTRGLLNGTSPSIREYVTESISSPTATTTSFTTATHSQQSIDTPEEGGGVSRGRRRGGEAWDSATSSGRRTHRPGSRTGADQDSVQQRSTAVTTHAGASPVPTVVVGGVLRCVCNAFLVSAQETLLECARCSNWCHPACVGVDHAELRQLQRSKSYVCPYCVATAGSEPWGSPTSAVHTHAPRAHAAAMSGDESTQDAVDVDTEAAPMTAVVVVGSPMRENAVWASPLALVGSPQTCLLTASRRPPVPRQVPLKLREIPDRLPASTALVEKILRLMDGLRRIARDHLGYDVIDLPATPLSDAEAAECLECCAAAVEDATFSESYPVYCLREVCNSSHPYVQGTLLRARRPSDAGAAPSSPAAAGAGGNPRGGRVCAMVLSNGMDGYGTLKATITQLKSAVGRGLIPSVAIQPTSPTTPTRSRTTRGAAGAAPPTLVSGVTPFMSQCLDITDVSDVVHITLSATHVSQQRKGLAKVLMAMDLLKWALRGRTRAYLNMAIEKRLVDGGTRVEYASSPASKHLYESFGFLDVFPRFDPATGKERWTAREADMGRAMANLNFVPHAVSIAEALMVKYEGGGDGRPTGGSGARRGTVTAVVTPPTPAAGGEDGGESAFQYDGKRSRSPIVTLTGKGDSGGRAAKRRLTLTHRN